MFGYPTGLGALIMRNDAVDVLQRHYFGGGTISSVTAEVRQHQQPSRPSRTCSHCVPRVVQDRFHVLKPRPCERFEDGTVPFLGIAALKHGFAALQKVGGMAAIQR